MAKLIQFPKVYRKAERLKVPSGETLEINQPIVRKPIQRETRSIFIQVVRDCIARDWERGIKTRDLAARYRVSRPEIEQIVHEEIVIKKRERSA